MYHDGRSVRSGQGPIFCVNAQNWASQGVEVTTRKAVTTASSPEESKVLPMMMLIQVGLFMHAELTARYVQGVLAAGSNRELAHASTGEICEMLTWSEQSNK